MAHLPINERHDSMKKVLLFVSKLMSALFKSMFSTKVEVMTDEVRDILSNSQDTEAYRAGIKKLNAGEEKVEVKLSGNRRLTLTQ